MKQKTNYYQTDSALRNKILRRFSMFDSVGFDLRDECDYETALDTAHINYTAEKSPLFLSDGTEVQNFFASVKSDDKQTVLGIVGNQYTPVSNKEAFGVAEQIVQDGWAKYETGGPCYGSKNSINYSKSFMVLRGEDFEIEDDVFNSFVLFNNSFDGSTGVTYRIICQRVVCLNGMVKMLGTAKNQFQINIQHSKSSSDKIRESQILMKQRLNEIDYIKREAEAFISQGFTRVQFEKEIIPQILKLKGMVEKDKDRERGQERIDNLVNQVISAYDAEDTQNYNGTAYKVLLALSDFESHAQPLRDCGNSQIYMNNISKGMLLTRGVAQFIAETRGIKVQ